MKQEILKFNDKERTSKLLASEDTQRGELRMEQSVADIEMTSKRPGLAKGKAGNRALLKTLVQASASQLVTQAAKN